MNLSKGGKHTENMETLTALLHNILLCKWKLEQWLTLGWNLRIMVEVFERKYIRIQKYISQYGLWAGFS